MAVLCGFKLQCCERVHIFEAKTHITFSRDESEVLVSVAETYVPLLNQRNLHVHHWFIIYDHVSEIEVELLHVDGNRRVVQVPEVYVQVEWK